MIGWREWVSLPGLGLPVIRAKVDTGAKTSSIHAFNIEPYFDRGRLRVCFQIHPLRTRSDLIVTCHADVVDYRSVSDSGGHREKRYVILTTLVLGEVELPIELTLANRESMTHKMLIGRAAMKHLMIDPSHAFLLGKPDQILGAYQPPKKKKKKKTSKKKLKKRTQGTT
ncbi:MAG: ATP-dependent zinc protease [Proteobacteria bacterium]|nr:MAG: ATP-dependent zinc protease [Pseudomonadota bacterium]